MRYRDEMDSVNAGYCFLTNDDGPNELLNAALRIATPLFSRVVTVVPETNQSAVAAAVTLDRPFKVWEKDPDFWLTTGFPADGVRFGLRHFNLGRPDVLISGINRGWNLGRCVVNSGTVGAALEGSRGGVSAICLSAERGMTSNPGWEDGVRQIIKSCMAVIRGDWREVIILSVNLPAVLNSPEPVFLPVSTVEYDEHYTFDGSGSERQVRVSGTTWLVDPLVPDIASLRRGVAIVNLVPTPWTRPSAELEDALGATFPTADRPGSS